MKKIIAIMLIAVMVLSFAGCGQKTESQAVPEAETTDVPVAGGWTPAESPEITDELRAIFEKALEGMLGANYSPVALISTQVVSGMNYCFLCDSTGVYPGAETKQVLVYIYEDLNGNAEVTDIVDLTEGTTESGNTQIPNPFADYSSIEEAAEAAGFDMSVPESIEGYSEKLIQVMNNEMIQVIFSEAESRLFIRKAAGSDDISGDYNVYSDEQTVNVGSREVSMKGNDGLVSTAVWTAGDYTYAVMADNAMSADAMAELISGIE